MYIAEDVIYKGMENGIWKFCFEDKGQFVFIGAGEELVCTYAADMNAVLWIDPWPLEIKVIEWIKTFFITRFGLKISLIA